MPADLVNYLSGFVTKRRLENFDKVLRHRTRYINLVCEDIYQGHNASALLRTCDCCGIQDIHIMEKNNSFEVNKEIALGASNWLTIKRYGNIKDSNSALFQNLRLQGYRIVGTTPGPGGVSLFDFDIEKGPVSLLFGTEKVGLSACMKEEADEFITVDMYGFTESYNVSVSAGIVLHYLRMKLMQSDIPWQLTEKEMLILKLEWLRKSIKRSDLIEKDFTRGE